MTVIVGTALITFGIGLGVLILAMRSVAQPGTRLSVLRTPGTPQTVYDRTNHALVKFWPAVAVLVIAGLVVLLIG